MKKVGIIMGKDSALSVVEKAVNTLKESDVYSEVHIYSAHRTPDEARTLASNERKNGFGIIIAAARMAVKLAGNITDNIALPVIGVPIKSNIFSNGIDALLSTVQMP